MKKPRFSKILTSFLLAGMALQAANVTLCYHKFEYSLNDLYSVLPEVFDWQMNYLKQKHIKVISMARMKEIYSSNRGSGDNVLLTIDDGWKSALVATNILWRYHYPVTFNIIPHVVGTNHVYMNISDLRNLCAIPGVEIGSHSYTHAVLLRLTPEALKKEIINSRYLLESALKRRVDTFAYPYGVYDPATRSLAAKTYRLCFSVAYAPNTDLANRSAIHREIVYQTTSFGEFMTMVDDAGKRSLDYRIEDLGKAGSSAHKYFNFITVRLFHFPAQDRRPALLVIPGSDIGPAWLHKAYKRVREKNIDVIIAVGRNNNLPFYRPDSEMRIMTNWGLPYYLQDLKNVLDRMKSLKKEFVILTWGDGFDLVMAHAVANGPIPGLRGIVTISPSIPDKNSSFTTNIPRLRSAIHQGRYSSLKLSGYLKLKTLSDLAILKPADISPFQDRKGSGQKSNYDTLLELFNDTRNPDTKLDLLAENYSYDDFKEAFMQPVPVFPMVQPISYLLDLNRLWRDGFVFRQWKITNPGHVRYPVVFIYSGEHFQSVERIKKTFSGLDDTGSYHVRNLSTLELMMSGITANIIVKTVQKFLGKGG